MLVSACASSIEDAYCPLARGQRLATAAGPDVATAVLGGRHHEVDTRSRILAVTLFVALRVAFSLTNNALGAHPDGALAESEPPEVRDSVRYGRPSGTTGR